jgi:hypothetical protein
MVAQRTVTGIFIMVSLLQIVMKCILIWILNVWLECHVLWIVDVRLECHFLLCSHTFMYITFNTHITPIHMLTLQRDHNGNMPMGFFVSSFWPDVHLCTCLCTCVSIKNFNQSINQSINQGDAVKEGDWSKKGCLSHYRWGTCFAYLKCRPSVPVLLTWNEGLMLFLCLFEM